MPKQTTHATREDAWVEHSHGRISARIWSPATDSTSAAINSPIVLFHDSLGCVDLWRTFPAALSQNTGRRVIAYDRLGFGRSDRRRDMPGLDFMSDEAETYFPALREQLGLKRFIAFGHSAGGAMALHCAARFRDACDAVITESAQAFLEDRTMRSISEAREQFKQEKQVGRLKKYHGDKATWVLSAWTETWLHPQFANWSLAAVLPRVTCPLLVIHGIHDEYGSTRHPEMIAELSGGPSRLEILADTYPVPHRERERAVVDLVTAFVASIKPISAPHGGLWPVRPPADRCE
jgi:pimeloyl-ACP methyl ester carboxylesterase